MKSIGLMVILAVSIFLSACDLIWPPPVLVTSITIIEEGGKVIVELGETLQMIAQIRPVNATDKRVTWSVENAGAVSARETRAHITQKGVLTGLVAGTVIVKATAQDGSAVEGTMVITVSEEEIFFPDPVLRQAVRDAEGYTGNPTGPIYKNEVLGITELVYWGSSPARESDSWNHISEWHKEELVSDYYGERKLEESRHHEHTHNHVPRAKISNLEGIQHLTSLKVLTFGNNQVSDISPVQNLVNLDWLWFNDNQVSDISPVQNLVNLKSLAFNGNQVSDITLVQNLLKLVFLDFQGNQVSDITSVQNLVNLKWLAFNGNQVSDITPVQNLMNLQLLSFWNIQVSDITPVQNLVNLEWLDFGNNQVSDITPVQNLVNLEILDFGNNQVSDITPVQNLVNLEWLSFYDNQVSDISPLQNLVNLKSLRFGNIQVSDITPVQNLVNLEMLRFNDNQVSDITPLQNMANLYILTFVNNQVSDLTPLVLNTGSFEPPSWWSEWAGIDMRHNNLVLTQGTQNRNDINTLIGRGVNVVYEPQN